MLAQKFPVTMVKKGYEDREVESLASLYDAQFSGWAIKEDTPADPPAPFDPPANLLGTPTSKHSGF